MKHFFTLLVMFFMTLFAKSQSFVFELNGEVLENDATVEFKAHEYLDEYEFRGQMYSEWIVECGRDETFLFKNNTSAPINYSATLSVPKMDKEWDLTWCMGETCKAVFELPMTINETLPSNDMQRVDYHAEIVPETEDYGTALSKITVSANGETRTVNVRFIYDASSNSISELSGNKKTEVARYSVDGRILRQTQKGINIIRMSDGSIRKLLVK